MKQDNNPVMVRLKELTEQVAQREGCRLYDLEFVGGSKGRGRVLRVYIDKSGGPVSVDDCANVSRGLNLILDVEDAMPGGAYVLEVSSPGLERPLRDAWHFQEAIGKKASVRLEESVDQFNQDLNKFRGAKTLKGEIQKVDGDVVTLLVDGSEVTFPLNTVERARLVFEFGQGADKGPKKHDGNKQKR